MSANGTLNGSSRWGDKKIFTTGEAAEVCKVSQQTIIRCFDAGRLGGFRVPGSKFRRIPRADLIRFMQDNEIPTQVLDAGPKRVLVVDDDQPILEMFQDVFARDQRFEVRTAGNGYDAGILTESFRPHLVILDFMLPDINGNVVCKRIREGERAHDTKIMIVSGVVNQGDVDALMKAGADDFLRKPFNIQQLMSRISTLLHV
ncbi:MAG: response regulator [Phycisphaerales bacterium]